MISRIADNRFFKGICGLNDKTKSYFLLLVLILCTFAVTFGNMRREGKVYAYEDIGSDTVMSYLPTYSYVSDRLSKGDLGIWADEYGFGNTLYSKSACYAEPVLAFVLFLTSIVGTGHMTVMLVFYKLLTTLLTAFLCYKFLELFSKKYYLVSIVAYIYAFNGFGMVWGQHYFYSSYNMYLIALFYCVERFLRYKKGTVPIFIVTFLSMIYTAYITYMILLVTGIYSIIRYVQINDRFSIKHFLSTYVRMGIAIILGMISTAFISLSSTLALLGSGRVSSDVSFVSNIIAYINNWLDIKSIIPLLQKTLTGSYSGVGDAYGYIGLGWNYYEAPQLFFSVFFFVALFPYFYSVFKSSRKRIITVLIGLALVIIALTNDSAKYIIYGCSAISTRFTFIFFPIFALVFYEGMHEIIYNTSKIKKVYLAGFVFTLIMLGKSWNDNAQDTISSGIHNQMVFNYIILALGGILLFKLSEMSGDKIKNWYICILAFIICCNVTDEFYIATNRSGAAEKKKMNYYYSDNDTRKALNYLKTIDNSYYRVDKTYFDCSFLTDSLLYDYKSVSDYNSVLSPAIKEYFTYYMNPRYTFYTMLQPSYMLSHYDIVGYSNLGLRYVLSQTELQDTDQFELIKKVGSILIYRNKYEKSFVSLFDKAVGKYEFVNYGYPERNKMITDSVIINDDNLSDFDNMLISSQQALEQYDETVINDCYSISDIIPSEAGTNSFVMNIDVNKADIKDEDMYIEYACQADNYQSVYMKLDMGNGFIEYNPYIVSLKDPTEVRVRYHIPKNTLRIKFETDGSGFNINTDSIKLTKSKQQYCSNQNIANVNNSSDGNILEGDVNCDNESIMMIPVTFDPDLSVYVDGEETKVYEVDSGLIGVKLSKGSHSFELVYNNSNMKKGAVVSLISILLFAAYAFLEKKLLRKADNI